MAPRISPYRPNQVPSQATSSSIEASKLTRQRQTQSRQGAVDEESLEKYTFAGSSKNVEDGTALQLAKPSSKNRMTDSDKTHYHASAYDTFLSLPDEIVLKMVRPGHFNPMQLMALSEHKNNEGGQSGLSRVAYDNKLWAPFAPQEENRREMPSGYHAEQFIGRYKVMSPEAQRLLNTLWNRTKEEKLLALLEIIEQPSLCSNYDIMRAGVSVEGRLLEYASENLKGDRDIVLAAVSQNGIALRHASENLKGDRDIVFTAVRNCGWAFKFADEDLQDDRESVLTAVRHYPRALEYVSESLQNDPELRSLAGWSPLL